MTDTRPRTKVLLLLTSTAGGLGAHGIAMVDAPVSGLVPRAEAGTERAPLTRDGRRLLILLCGCLALWITDRWHGIAPGWIHTDMTEPMAPMHPILEMQTPMGRLGEPDDIAWCAVYLASPEAGFVTGQTLSPNGGWYMSQ